MNRNSPHRNIPHRIVFTNPPFGMVTFQKGEYTYKRLTRVRLRHRKSDGAIWFLLKSKYKYVQDPSHECIFRLQ